MCVIQGLNDQELTIVLVTHEPDIARYARRIIVVRDGTIRTDEPVNDRLRADEVLKTLPALED
jgi:putative ABC transport system ATP-binding protein